MTKSRKSRRNTELFHSIADAIRTEPAHYNQHTFGKRATEHSRHSCGTAHCIAGFAAALSGYIGGEYTDILGFNRGWQVVSLPDEGFLSIEPLATELLGLTPGETETLFNPYWRPTGCPTDASMGSDVLAEAAAQAMDDLAEGAKMETVTETVTT